MLEDCIRGKGTTPGASGPQESRPQRSIWKPHQPVNKAISIDSKTGQTRIGFKKAYNSVMLRHKDSAQRLSTQCGA